MSKENIESLDELVSRPRTANKKARLARIRSLVPKWYMAITDIHIGELEDVSKRDEVLFVGDIVQYAARKLIIGSEEIRVSRFGFAIDAGWLVLLPNKFVDSESNDLIASDDALAAFLNEQKFLPRRTKIKKYFSKTMEGRIVSGKKYKPFDTTVKKTSIVTYSQ